MTSKLFLSLLFAFTILSVTDRAFSSPSKELTNIVKQSKVPNQDLSLSVQEVVNGDSAAQLEINQKAMVIPASLSKVVTALAVLDTFSPGHKWMTQLIGKPGKKDSILEGDLCLKGGGDASFVSETLWFLVNEFTRSSIRSIKGDIVVDDSYFDAVRFDSSRESTRVDRAYDSPIGAMTFNWSSVNVFVRPSTPGKEALVISDPVNEYIKVTNKAKTVSGNANSIKVKRVKITKPTAGGFVDEIIVTGSIGTGVLEAVKYKAISDPALWSGYNLVAFLKQRGIEVTGKVKIGKCSHGEVLAKAEGKPVELIVRDMMKFSNNYVAEILTKNMGAQKYGSPGTMEKGIRAIEEFLKKRNLKDLKIVNPSGLSRDNKVSSHSLTQLMLESYKDFKTFPEYLTSNAIGGVDGTLKSRSYKEKNQGRVRAKTGRLSGVIGLSGVVGSQSGRQFFFTFIYNGKNSGMTKALKLFDDLANALAEK